MAPNQQPSTNLRSLISEPKNFERRLHVDKDFNWSGQDPYSIFTVSELLGEGAYGSVYKVSFQQTGFIMAAKTIKAEADHTQSICKEIEMLKRVHHPNLVSYYGSCLAKDATELWILMEYCGNGSVSDLLRLVQSVPERSMTWILQSALKGLCQLHSQQIIHRDVKAANILLTELGDVKIADFGVADQVSHTVCARRTVIGTPFWMAPEVISGRDYNCSADIWSLGITAIEMAEGAPPLARQFSNPMRALFQIPHLAPPRLQDGKRWSAQLQAFLESCLQKDAARRETAQQLLDNPLFRLHDPASGRKELLEIIVAGKKRLIKMQSTVSKESQSTPQPKKLQRKRKASAAVVSVSGPAAEPIKEADEDADGTKLPMSTVIVHSDSVSTASSSPVASREAMTMLVKYSTDDYSDLQEPLLSSPILEGTPLVSSQSTPAVSNDVKQRVPSSGDPPMSTVEPKRKQSVPSSDHAPSVGYKVTGIVILGLALAVFYYKHQLQTCQMRIDQLLQNPTSSAASSSDANSIFKRLFKWPR